MRFVPNKRPLPRCFMQHPKGKGIVAEADLSPHPSGKLSAKLLVFRTTTELRKFWRHALGSPLGWGCRGVVSALAGEGEQIDGWQVKGPTKFYGDPRYFCVIGLCRNHLCMEVIAHEAVHAGFCYEKRVKRNLFGEAAKDFDEERIAYPAGAIAAGINRFLHDKGLYQCG